jgi:hypothetical protein
MNMIEELNNKNDSSGETVPHEGSKYARHPFTATVEAVDFMSQTRILGRTSDLNRVGCYVDTISSFPTGSILKLRLTKDVSSFEAQAEVVYSLVGMGMGVKFTYASPEQLSVLEKWVEELSGESLPEQEMLRTSSQSLTQEGSADEESQVLNELVRELMRQRVLPDAKCEAMLEKLSRTGRAKCSPVYA